MIFSSSTFANALLSALPSRFSLDLVALITSFLIAKTASEDTVPDHLYSVAALGQTQIVANPVTGALWTVSGTTVRVLDGGFLVKQFQVPSQYASCSVAIDRRGTALIKNFENINVYSASGDYIRTIETNFIRDYEPQFAVDDERVWVS